MFNHMQCCLLNFLKFLKFQFLETLINVFTVLTTKKREKEFNKNKERRKMRQFTINSCHILLFKREIWDYGKEKKVKC